MTVNAYEEFLEIGKELFFADIPIADIQVSYRPPEGVGEILSSQLQRKDMEWDGEILSLDGTERFPDKFYSSSVVPLHFIWLDFGCGGVAFNPNLNPKVYFVDGLKTPRRIEIERKIDEIMAHYHYLKVADF